ncbi:hypothetical protein [Clostridium sp.]
MKKKKTSLIKGTGNTNCEKFVLSVNFFNLAIQIEEKDLIKNINVVEKEF